VCYMDLDQFKLVNDTSGHIAGDELLRRIGAILSEQVRDSDIVARLGGDEFGFLLVGCDTEQAGVIAERACAAVRDYRFTWEDTVFKINASVGLVPISLDSGGVADILSAADQACYVAKDKGGGRVQVFQPGDRDLASRMGEMHLVVRIQKALEDSQFELVGQPILHLHESPDTGWTFEVLLRMSSGDAIQYPPSQLIKAAERYGLMLTLDRWVVGRVLRVLGELPQDIQSGPGTCFVNLSGVTLSDPAFVDYVSEQLSTTGVPPERVCFEITETAAVEHIEQAQEVMRILRSLGCRFALDDFGQGMSSYGYLKNLPVSFLKIDGLFIQDIAKDPLDRAMVESINQLAQLYGLQTVAESVSSPAVLEVVRTVGINYAQGHHVSLPQPLSEIVAGLVEAQNSKSNPT